MRPERSAAMIINTPTRARVKTKICGFRVSMRMALNHYINVCLDMLGHNCSITPR
jgi:hypothetical protein